MLSLSTSPRPLPSPLFSVHRFFRCTLWAKLNADAFGCFYDRNEIRSPYQLAAHLSLAVHEQSLLICISPTIKNRYKMHCQTHIRVWSTCISPDTLKSVSENDPNGFRLPGQIIIKLRTELKTRKIPSLCRQLNCQMNSCVCARLFLRKIMQFSGASLVNATRELYLRSRLRFVYLILNEQTNENSCNTIRPSASRFTFRRSNAECDSDSTAQTDKCAAWYTMMPVLPCIIFNVTASRARSPCNGKIRTGNKRKNHRTTRMCSCTPPSYWWEIAHGHLFLLPLSLFSIFIFFLVARKRQYAWVRSALRLRWCQTIFFCLFSPPRFDVCYFIGIDRTSFHDTSHEWHSDFAERSRIK